MNTLVSAQKINKIFKGQNIKNKVLNEIDLDIYENDFTVIMGSSGAGKSTLLYVLSGMDNIDDGKILYKGKDISKNNEKEMARLRTNEFGFVFQQTHLVSNLTLYENVIIAGMLKDGIKQNEIENRANEILNLMNIKDAKTRLPSHTSGGEQQRAAIARAIINNPTIIFADEPTGALNRNNGEEVLDLLNKLNNNGQSILMVTHDVRAAIRGNRILYLEDGKIIGEKKMPKYDESTSKKREEELNSWLTNMKW